MIEINFEEKNYLDLCNLIINEGEIREDRTGTGVKSIFAPNHLKFDLSNDQFPLLTTKKVFLKGIIHELLWFISGKTNSKELTKLGVKIWDQNGSREYLDLIGLNNNIEGDLGPIYGFQWRHFGAKYINCKTDYSGQGIDQLDQIIKTLKHDPFNRRIIMTAWNPVDIPKMSLPPCHAFCQFYVSSSELSDKHDDKKKKKYKLSCLLYQRSCDMGLGIPFNIASYALLTKMIAHIVDMDCGEFIHSLGDAHVYLNHISLLKEQIERVPRKFPKLVINEKRKKEIFKIEDFKYEDFELSDYNPYPEIKMKMSV